MNEQVQVRRSAKSAEAIRREERKAVVRFIESMALAATWEIFGDDVRAKAVRVCADNWSRAIRERKHRR